MQQDRGESKTSLRGLYMDYKARKDKEKRRKYNKAYFAKRYADDEEFRERRKAQGRARNMVRRKALGGMPGGHRSVWTEDKIAVVKDLWERGWSASMIAEAVGAVSRSAVIGVINRRGLTRSNGGAS